MGGGRTYMEIMSSLMIYPIPNPSAATGPNPNNLSAGLPQLEVERILVLSNPQPGSLKISGRESFADEDDEEDVDDVSLAGGGSLISRWRRQYNAYRCLMPAQTKPR